MLRVVTAGSVDDGKSTLVGRLLLDTDSVADDHLDELRAAAAGRGQAEPDLALLTDGLRAEREQGITIDVAHRYFRTARRAFVFADAPGHEQYTRNMVTAASTADAALLLTDLSAGLTTQTARHLAVLATMRVPRLVVCANKIDLAGYAREPFERMRNALEATARRLGMPVPVVVPLSARHGDNVVERSARTPWYDGPVLLDYLETVGTGESGSRSALRLPVQTVLQQKENGRIERWYAGRLAAGEVHRGTPVRVLPGGSRTTVTAVRDGGGEVATADTGTSVAVTLTDDVDLSRGGMLAAADEGPVVAGELRAAVCWLDEQPLKPGAVYALRHTSRWVRAVVERVEHRLELPALTEVPADHLDLNDIGAVVLKLSEPVFADRYARNRVTGSFVLIDETTAATAGAGMVDDAR
ncbi:GTP-binding protein [Saccharothrix sp. AJ9571]|nr:GTP-binding protein [Saccharothrix sp. AJ9571]